MTKSNASSAAAGAPASSDILDVVIVGGGPAGTAAAFRAKELGLKLLVVDFDDVLKRIRDYPKDKLILPDFGGGDRMAFPAGGDCVAALQFEPIDKDDICARWKAHYKTFDIPTRIGVELQGIERHGDLLHVLGWDHKQGDKVVFRTRHLVLAIGRGVPRRLDISGNTDGIAYRMTDPAKYVEGPVLVVGGGTSAAEAVLAISRAKIAAEEPCNVYWAFRGTRMPRVSKALAEQFFEAYIGNGNIRSLPDGDPSSVVTGPDRVELLSVRVDRKTPEGRPPETVHLEFLKTRCIACIGEDIPEALLLSLGIAMVPVGDGKKMAVTPLLETQQPNVYLIGDLLSQSYLEINAFTGAATPAADQFRQVKHRGNIKSSLRDGVFVAEVIKQRLDGRDRVEVVIKDAAPAAASAGRAAVNRIVSDADVVPAASAESAKAAPVSEEASLVLLSPAGGEVGEYRINAEGTTTIGRIDRDIAFKEDQALSDAHASISSRNGEFYLRDDGSRSGTYLRLRPDRPMPLSDGDLLRAGRQLLVVSRPSRGATPQVEHYDAAGRSRGVYPVKGTTVMGRSGGKSNPDVILDENDPTLSRFHMSFVMEGDAFHAQDFASKNGTYLKVDTERKLEHGDIIRVGAQQLVVRLREELPEKKGSAPVPEQPASAADAAPLAPTAPAPAPAAPAAAKGAAAGAVVTFAGQNKSGPLDPAETLLQWADNNEVAIDYECWAGMCGCDAIKIVSGAEFLNEVTEKEIKTLKRKGLKPGECRLACMTRASGPVVVEVVK